MITRFWWVRHGPTHAKSFAGWRDIPADLSDSAALSRLENGLPDPALLVSSDLVRASATADAVQGARKRLDHRMGLRELNFGVWDGVAFGDVAKNDPEGSRAFWETPGDFAPPEGESWNALVARISGELDEMIENHAGEQIVAVAHFAVILSAIQLAGGLEAKQAFRFKIDNLSVTQLDYLHDAKTWRINGINHVL